MKIDIIVNDCAIILNALHYYKKVEKKGNFDLYTGEKINTFKNKLAHQMVWEQGVVK